MVMSGGTEGGLSPHFLVFARRDLTSSPSAGARKTLAIGTAFTRAFRPEEIGRTAQIEATADAVRTAMAQAGIDNKADVHFVQVSARFSPPNAYWRRPGVGRPSRPATLTSRWACPAAPRRSGSAWRWARSP
jgi:hypothetical protein